MKDINLVLENVVYMELLRRGYSVTVGKVSDKEIDFVCEDHGKKLYVQVSYLLASEETIQREFGAFAGVRDNFPKYVVTMDELDMSEMESNTAIFVTSCWQRNGTEMFFVSPEDMQKFFQCRE